MIYFQMLLQFEKSILRKESISVVIPLEEINCYSASAILSEHKIDRSNISIDNIETSITGLSDLENHYRKRRQTYRSMVSSRNSIS